MITWDKILEVIGGIISLISLMYLILRPYQKNFDLLRLDLTAMRTDIQKRFEGVDLRFDREHRENIESNARINDKIDKLRDCIGCKKQSFSNVN
jgi:hypothetical protein